MTKAEGQRSGQYRFCLTNHTAEAHDELPDDDAMNMIMMATIGLHSNTSLVFEAKVKGHDTTN